MLLGEFKIIIAQEEYVRIVTERPAVQMAAENGIGDCVLRGRNLVVNVQSVIIFSFELQIDVTADPASVHDPERRTQRHAATEYQFVAHAFAQKFHCVRHDLAAAQPVSGEHALTVQKVELDHVVAPIVQNDVEEISDILAHLFVIQIQSIRAAPAHATYYRIAAGIFDHPIGVLSGESGLLLRIEGCKPYSRQIAFFVNLVGDVFHAVRKFFARIQPVADKSLEAVVYLEYIDRVADSVQSVQISQDDVFVDLLKIIVPAGISRHMLDTRFRDTHLFEIGIENFVVSSFDANDVHQLVAFARCNDGALDVLGNLEIAAVHIHVENRKSRFFV